MAQIKKEELSTNKVENDSSTAPRTREEQSIGWAGVHVEFMQNDDKFEEYFRRLILLDSDSNTTIFCKKEYVD